MSLLFPIAKINLGLRILSKRPDGYHELSSLIIPLPGLHDVLTIEPASKAGLELECDCDFIKDVNILQKTYDLFGKHKGFYPPLYVKLEKRIPIGAGLGGGSSDAASFLRYLANLYPEPIPEKELISLGLRIGADVPFFLIKQAAHVSGLGEIIRPLNYPLPKLHFLLVWPELHISTRWAFETFDKQYTALPPFCKIQDKKDLTKSSGKATQFFPDKEYLLQDILSNLYNDLEEPLFSHYPFLKELKLNFLKSGALASGMSGSGSTIYGIYSDREIARIAAAELQNKYKRVYQISI